MADPGALGVVAIGRNEGERLVACLASVPTGVPVVYVDSASTDGSAVHARSVGAEVVDLDLSRPFTAARARNEGLARLRELWPQLRYVQFVDGDCTLAAGWLQTAQGYLEGRPRLAVVCGRRSERFPHASRYNAMCDAEWNTAVGPAAACGGDALMRIAALEEVGAFDPLLTAHEEPDLCHRLRERGWGVERIDAPMTLHDAAITRFGQWWRRNLRAGYGYAQSFAKYRGAAGNPAQGLFPRAFAWGLALPVALLLASVALWPWGLLGWLIYPAQWLRLAVRERRGRRPAERALFTVLAKFAEGAGILRFAADRLQSRRRSAITYK